LHLGLLSVAALCGGAAAILATPNPQPSRPWLDDDDIFVEGYTPLLQCLRKLCRSARQCDGIPNNTMWPCGPSVWIVCLSDSEKKTLGLHTYSRRITQLFVEYYIASEAVD